MSPSILALDVGNRRVGLALATTTARMASPFTTLEQSEGLFGQLATIIQTETVQQLVVGLPRGLEGQATDQTKQVQAFAEELKRFGLPIAYQDEALTSKKAEAELQARGRPYARGDVDALAATYILEDYLAQTYEG